MIICPKCKGDVYMTDSKSARCSRHGGTFQVLHAAPHIRRMADPDRPTLHAKVDCSFHPGVAALHGCKRCRRPLCKVCDFNFGGGNHFCPECVVASPASNLSTKRRSVVRFAYIMAATSTISFLLVMFMFRNGGVGSVIMGALMGIYLVLIPPIVGFFTALESMDKYEGNPASVWGAVIWNGALGTVFIVIPMLAVLGAIMGVL